MATLAKTETTNVTPDKGGFGRRALNWLFPQLGKGFPSYRELQETIGTVITAGLALISILYTPKSAYDNLVLNDPPIWTYVIMMIVVDLLLLGAFFAYRSRRPILTTIGGVIFTVGTLGSAVFLVSSGTYNNPVALAGFVVVVVASTFLTTAIMQIVLVNLFAIIPGYLAFQQVASGVEPVGVWNPPFAAAMYFIISNAALVIMNGFRYVIWRYSTDKIKAEEKLQGANAELQQSLSRETELKDEQIVLREKAEAANKIKDSFLHNTSHELRTPLNAIINYSSILMEMLPDPLTEKQKELLGHIKRNGEKQLTLVNDILDLASIEAGQVRVTLEPINPRSFIPQHAADTLQSNAQKKNLELKVTIEPSTPETVTTDKTRVEQIITNLAGNAIKFTKEGHVEVKVGSNAPATWYVAVCDTGTGIPQDQIGLIFEKFHQVDSSDARASKGTGLGLAITRGLINALEGNIKVESEMGKGSTFTVTFPVSPKPKTA